MNETLTTEWSLAPFETGFSLEKNLDAQNWLISLERLT